MPELNANAIIDTFLLDCATYKDYLDSFVTNADYRYLRDKLYCRAKVSLNYNPAKEVYTQEQFEAYKGLLREQMSPTRGKIFYYGNKIRPFDPVLSQLAAREKPNYQKTLSTIIFLTYRNKNGFEVSGFIDFESSLQRSNFKVPGAIDWLGVYREKVRLRPKPHDLSYFDMHKGIVLYNSSENYFVQHDIKEGLIFMHRGDHKKICIGSKNSDDRNFFISTHFSKIYGYVILFDHIVRKKI